jgi:hypothetical protein
MGAFHNELHLAAGVGNNVAAWALPGPGICQLPKRR